MVWHRYRSINQSCLWFIPFFLVMQLLKVWFLKFLKKRKDHFFKFLWFFVLLKGFLWDVTNYCFLNETHLPLFKNSTINYLEYVLIIFLKMLIDSKFKRVFYSNCSTFKIRFWISNPITEEKIDWISLTNHIV